MDTQTTGTDDKATSSSKVERRARVRLVSIWVTGMFFAAIFVVVLIGLVSAGTDGDGVAGNEPTHCAAVAMLYDVDGREVGDVAVIGGPNGATLRASFENLPPGSHGFHLHETGACSPDFEAAGGHFNPTGRHHGFLHPEGFHLGDLPNVKIPESGTVSVSHFLPRVEVCADTNALLDDDGAAVIVHQNADDHMSGPAGEAGIRIACGVFRRGG